MAYLGTTQASSKANPPVLLAGGMAAGAAEHIDGSSGVYQGNAYPSTAAYNTAKQFGQSLWMYNTTDVTTAVIAAGYFSDAGQIGMRPGDVIIVVAQGTTVTSSQVLRICTVGSISSAGAATLSTGAYITATT